MALDSLPASLLATTGAPGTSELGVATAAPGAVPEDEPRMFSSSGPSPSPVSAVSPLSMLLLRSAIQGSSLFIGHVVEMTLSPE